MNDRIADLLELLVYAECLKSLDFAKIALGPEARIRLEDIHAQCDEIRAIAEVRNIINARK